jgi:hypothetical protein
MKYLDSVKIITDKYKDKGILFGCKGVIISAPIRNNSFEVEVLNVSKVETFVFSIEELEVEKESNATDNDILEDLPQNDPRWWCKVENGYIFNLLGEKKNKEPYKYNS